MKITEDELEIMALEIFQDVDKAQNELIGGQITLVGHLVDDLLIVMLVKVIGVGIEDGVASEPIRLVDLKVEADRGHGDPVNLQ